jgi:hypothetical protein
LAGLVRLSREKGFVPLALASEPSSPLSRVLSWLSLHLLLAQRHPPDADHYPVGAMAKKLVLAILTADPALVAYLQE